MVESLLNNRDLLPDESAPQVLETRYRNRSIDVQTTFGQINLKRSYIYHRKAKSGYAPLDVSLDLVGGHTPALARLICRASAQSGSFTQAAEDLEAYTGLKLEGRDSDASLLLSRRHSMKHWLLCLQLALIIERTRSCMCRVTAPVFRRDEPN